MTSALFGRDKQNINSDAGKTGEYSYLERAYSSFENSMQDISLAYKIHSLIGSGNFLHAISCGMKMPSRGMDIHLYFPALELISHSYHIVRETNEIRE